MSTHMQPGACFNQKQEPINLNSVTLSPQAALASITSGAIHSCCVYSLQEVDPDMKSRGPSSASCNIKYRGSRVLDGAQGDCAFFQQLIMRLYTVLTQTGYE